MTSIITKAAKRRVSQYLLPYNFLLGAFGRTTTTTTTSPRQPQSPFHHLTESLTSPEESVPFACVPTSPEKKLRGRPVLLVPMPIISNAFKLGSLRGDKRRILAVPVVDNHS